MLWDERLFKEWDEAKHSRKPAGSEAGGEFASSGETEDAAAVKPYVDEDFFTYDAPEEGAFADYLTHNYTTRWVGEWSAEERINIATAMEEVGGLPPGVELLVTRDDYAVNLDGQKFLAAGAYDERKNTVILYGSAVAGKRGELVRVIRHEIMHVHFGRMLFEQKSDWMDIQKELRDGTLDDRSTFRLDNSEVKGEARHKKWFGFQAVEFMNGKTERLAKYGGLTEYARAWWGLYRKDKTHSSWLSATNETLAEMASRPDKRKGASRQWKELYRRTMRASLQNAKKRDKKGVYISASA